MHEMNQLHTYVPMTLCHVTATGLLIFHVSVYPFVYVLSLVYLFTSCKKGLLRFIGVKYIGIILNRHSVFGILLFDYNIINDYCSSEVALAIHPRSSHYDYAVTYFAFTASRSFR